MRLLDRDQRDRAPHLLPICRAAAFRAAFGVAIVSTLVLIVVLRLVFATLFVQPVRGELTGELQIVDGVRRYQQGARHVFDARAAGVRPDIGDPDMLSRLALLVEPYDRVVVSTTEEPAARMGAADEGVSRHQRDPARPGQPARRDRHFRFHGNDTVIVGARADVARQPHSGSG
ncbi:hypothetical protein AB5I41_20310 [Sphingomonas sp. MMS24-JH45]